MGLALSYKTNNLVLLSLRQKNENANILSVFYFWELLVRRQLFQTAVLSFQSCWYYGMRVVNKAQEFSSKANRSLEGHKLGSACPVSLFSVLFPCTIPAPGSLPHCHTHVPFSLNKGQVWVEYTKLGSIPNQFQMLIITAIKYGALWNMPGFVLSGLHALSWCFSRSNPWWLTLQAWGWLVACMPVKMQIHRFHSTLVSWASCGEVRSSITLTSTFSTPDAQEVQELVCYFSKQMGLKCNLLSFHCSDFCAYIFRAKKVKKKILWTGRCGRLMPLSSWWLWLCPYSQRAFEIPSICLYCGRIKNWEVFSWWMVACALNIERDASGTTEAGPCEWLHGSCTAQPDVMALSQEWKPGILLGPGVAHSLEEKVTDVLAWVSGTRNLRLPLVITPQGAWNLQGCKFLGSWVYFRCCCCC